MLLGSLFSAAMMTLLAAAFLSAGLAMTHATIRRAAETYVASGLQIAVRDVQNRLSAAAQNGTLNSPLPAVSPAPPACADPRCGFAVSESVQYIAYASPGPSPAASCDPHGTNCALGEQTNAAVAEGRVSARITVTVTDANRNVLVTRSRDVTFRTFRSEPYAVLTGSRDDTTDITGASAAGDDGGLPAATPNPCSSAAAGSADDTAVRVAYENAVTNACADGSSWQNQSYSQQAAQVPGWSR